MNLTKEQAAQITDIESYKSVTGAKRFKRTKDEMDRGLTVEQALAERLDGLKDDKKKSPITHNGCLTIVVKPEKGVPQDYFEQFKNKTLEIVLDKKFYGWLDTKLDCPYNGDMQLLFKDILDLGMGEVVVQRSFEEDLNKQ